MSDVQNLVERLRQIAESQRMDFDSPNVAATLDDAATTLESLARIGSVVPEEPEGKRWFSAAYRARNGNVIPIGDETVVREHAQATADEFSREDDEGPGYFQASRIIPPWMPVEGGE